MNLGRMIRAMRPGLGVVGLLVVLGAGFLGSALVSSSHAGTPPFPDVRGAWDQYTCGSGTLADCEANPQYHVPFTISDEDFNAGTVTLSDGTTTGTINGCTMVLGPPITDSTPQNPYTSQGTYTISADATHLTGTFDDSYGRRGAPLFASRTSGGPSTCPATGSGTTTSGPTSSPTTTSTPSTPTTTPTTTTPTDTTTSTSTTTPALKATATQVSCDYYVATSNDTCHVSVGDATGSASSPTGTVTFSGDRSGACSLTPTPSSPGSGESAGVSSCAITVAGSETQFLNITASYPGDVTHAPSSGSTQWLNAAPGNSLSDPTIQKFDPPTLQFVETNPVAGSTLTGEATLTDGASEDESCQVPSTPDDPTMARNARHRPALDLKQMSVKSVVRHAAKGKVTLKLNFKVKRLRKLFPGNHTMTLRVALTVAPPHGAAQTVFETETLKLHVPKRGPVRVTDRRRQKVVQARTGAAAASQLIAHAADGSTFTYGGSEGDCSIHLSLNLPDPATDQFWVKHVTGSLTGEIADPTCENKKVALNFSFDGSAGLGQAFTGSAATNHGRATYVANSAGARVYGVVAGACGEPLSFNFTLPVS